MMDMDDRMMNEGMTSFSWNVLAGTTSKYIEFNEADYQKALDEGKTILLFFYADWCPSCRAEQVDTHAGFDRLDDPDVVGFRVNYKDSKTDDFETQLAKDFGISFQHTKIILEGGERVLKSPETWDADRYVA
jgi:thiol-disulfide isomerase/thioredoxin